MARLTAFVRPALVSLPRSASSSSSSYSTCTGAPARLSSARPSTVVLRRSRLTSPSPSPSSSSSSFFSSGTATLAPVGTPSRMGALFSVAKASMSSSAASTDPQSAHARRQGADPPAYLDVRTPGEFADGHAPGAVNVPVLLAGQLVPTFVDDVAANLPKGPLIVGCKSGRRSMKAIELLQQAGWTDLTNLDGGFDAWAADPSLPTEK